MGQVTFTVGVPADLLEAVEAAAQKLSVSRNRYVRQALEAALISNERMARALPPEALEAALAIDGSAPAAASPRAPESPRRTGVERLTPEQYAEIRRRR